MLQRLRKWLRADDAATRPVAVPEKKRARISDGVLGAAAVQRRKTVQPVFTLPQHPPGVVPRGARMAMDGVPEMQGWANSFALAGFMSEGITFLGYAYLSELAQRPEYRVISETIATEMTREWIEFFSTDDEDDSKGKKIAELEAEFKRLNVANLFCRATQQDGFFGRGHIYIDTGDSDDPAELQKPIGDGWDRASKAKIRKGSIKALRTVEAVWCYPTSYNSNDPLKDDWYRPNSWYVQSKIVHSSRLITFIGREVPDLLKPTYSFGGLSLSQMAKPYVDNWLETRQSVNDIIHSFVTFVLKTGLQSSLQGDGDEMFRRAELFTQVRDNRGLMMIDKDEEEFAAVSAPLSGLDQLQAQAQEHMAAISHIPTVKLLGIQPAGLNASSEDQLRVFYDYIHAYQEHLYRDKIRRLMGLVMLSLWGETDETIDFKFKPLFSLDEKSAAEVEKTKAERDQILVDSGVLDPAEVRQRVAHDPDSDYSAIDVDDLPDLREEEEAGLEPVGGRPQPVAEEDGKGLLAGMDEAAPAQGLRWITLENGSHVLIDGNGVVQGGMGGKFNGKPISEIGRAPGNNSGSTADIHAAIKRYTGADYRPVQATLRGGKPADDNTKRTIRNLDALMESASLSEDKTLYRAFGSLAVQQLLSGATKGSVFEDPGFASSTDKYEVAHQFFQQSSKSILVTIKARKGSKAADISKQSDDPSESEYLIDRHSRYKVVKFDPKKRMMEVELLQEGGEKKAFDAARSDLAKDAGKEAPAKSGFRERFETDEPGAIRWIEGEADGEDEVA